MTRACLCLLAGCYALQLSSFAISSDLTTAAFVASFILLIIPRLRPVGFFLAGAGLFGHAALAVIDSRIAPELVGDSIVALVRIDNFPQRDAATVSFLAVPRDDKRLPPRLRLSWFEPPVGLRVGDHWQLELRLRRPRGSSNPGVFDYEAWLFREKIGATGYVVNSHRNHLLDSGPTTVINAVRQRFVKRVSMLLPDASHSAILSALVVGARHAITREQWDRYARTGTSHLVAISGLHIGLAAAGGYVMACIAGGLINRRGNNHHLAVVVSLLVAVIYALVAGLAVPARRACLMIAVAGIAVLRRRVPRPSTIVAVACAGSAVTAPLATMSPGFKLSFAAVIVLIWIGCRYRYTESPGDGRFVSIAANARRLGAIQVLLLLGLLPLSVLTFARFSLAAPAINFVAVPLFSLVIVPFSLFGLLLDGPFEAVGDFALHIAGWSIGFLEKIIAAGASMPGSSFTIPAMSGAAWLCVFLPAFWVIAPPGWPGRQIGLLALVAMLLHAPAGPAPGCFTMQVLDVGQGLATIVRTERRVLVFDTGPSYRGGGDAAESVILPYLASRGIRRIDRLVVSHADLDHAGGARKLVANVDTGDLISGESLHEVDTETRRCVADDAWQFDGVRFRFLHPPADSGYSGNDSSCVLLIEAGRHRVMLTGDIEAAVEQELVRKGNVSDVDVVVVPHHGSRTSSTSAFVRALSPSLAIIPAGFGNRWGFPKQEVVDRWRLAGASVLVTATSGAIGLTACTSAEQMPIREQRRERHRIWHQ